MAKLTTEITETERHAENNTQTNNCLPLLAENLRISCYISYRKGKNNNKFQWLFLADMIEE